MVSCKPARSAFPPTDSHWLSPHRSGFLESLAAQGYAVRTVKSFRLMVGRLCAEAEARGLGPCALDANIMRELADACPRTGTAHMERELARATRRFTDYLVRAGAIAAAVPTPPPAGSPEQLCAELDHWLRNHRGMFGNRLRVHRKVLRRVTAFCCTATGTAEDLAAVTPEAVFAFLECCAGRAGWRLPYVRNILRFLFWSGRIPQDLSAAVPVAAGGRPDGLPRHLEAGVVRKLLEAIRGDRPCDLRDHAMLLLMARLGLRAQEVVAARLDDIDWGAGRMLVRGKGGQLDRVPIPVDVGEAIVSWVRGGRRGDSRHVFVCVRPPYAPLTSSEAIRDALRNAYRRADLVPPGGQVRTHALRHGLAMALLDQGSSLAEIGDVLRHRCARSTTAYARYDHGALRPLARPWPVPGGGR